MKQDLGQIETVLLDIEGTVCPISFVKETLFPYAIKALPTVLASRWDDPEFVSYRDAFPSEARRSPEAFQAHVQDLTDRDVKVAYLKNLQGYLWQSGYESQAYSTPLFPDVLPTLQAWHSRSLALAIYSSGSIFAQKLLFRHISQSSSNATTDATHLISAWFDTTNAGPKTSSQSYTTIANEISQQPDRILFLSDNTAEIRAALDAGMKAIVVDRPGNAEIKPDEREELDVVSDFEQLGLL